MLTKGKGLSTAQFATLVLDTPEAAFAGIGMLFRSHLHIVLGVASIFVVQKESAITPVKDVDFWIGQSRVSVSITCAILMAEEFSPEKH